MNTFSRVAIAIAGMTGVAAAQDMKPPPELAEMARSATGTWHCKGQGMDHNQKMVDMTATMKLRLEVASWWIHGSFESRVGKEPFTFEAFTTFDPRSHKWNRVMVESGGNWSSGDSSGLKDGKIDWELTTHSSAMGDGMFRDHEDLSDPKAGARMWGEFSPDRGKTWVKVYEMACKK